MIYKVLGHTGVRIPAIGQGSMGVRDEGIFRRGIELGMTFIDTAESYGNEDVIGKAIKGRRGMVFVSTKVSPEHLDYEGVMRSAEGSLERLGTDYIDLYQAHWPNPGIRIEETMRAMERLVQEGKVRYIGLSNYFVRGLLEAGACLTVNSIVSVQLEYNLFDRGIERDVLPFCESKGITVIAYSPLDQGRIGRVSSGWKETTAQVILNWLISHKSVVAIPKSSSLTHVEENAAAADFELSSDDFDEMDRLNRRECLYLSTDQIRVSQNGRGGRGGYQTREEAIENKQGHVPSPMVLGGALNDYFKPVRVVRNCDGTYDLIEGRIRYWSWVLAYGNRPIPALEC